MILDCKWHVRRRNSTAGWWQGEDGGVLKASAVGEKPVKINRYRRFHRHSPPLQVHVVAFILVLVITSSFLLFLIRAHKSPGTLCCNG